MEWLNLITFSVHPKYSYKVYEDNRNRKNVHKKKNKIKCFSKLSIVIKRAKINNNKTSEKPNST